VPHAIKMQEKYGKDGFVALLLESQGLDPTDIPGFMWKRFPTNKTWLSTSSDAPFPSSGAGLPSAALVGVDGTILWQANPNGAPKKLEEMVEAELKKAKSGWGKGAAKKARGLLYGKNAFVEAAKTVNDALAQAKDDEKEDLEAVAREVEVRREAFKKAPKVLSDDARFLDAQKAAENYAKWVKGNTEWENEASALVLDFARPEVVKEIDLDKALRKIVASAGDKAPTPDVAKALRTFAKKNEGSRVGARATMLAAAAEFDPNKK